MENIVTQENLLNSCEETSTSENEEAVDEPLAQYYDVEMQRIQPNPARDNLDRHATQLLAPAKSCEKVNTGLRESDIPI